MCEPPCLGEIFVALTVPPFCRLLVVAAKLSFRYRLRIVYTNLKCTLFSTFEATGVVRGEPTFRRIGETSTSGYRPVAISQMSCSQGITVTLVIPCF